MHDPETGPEARRLYDNALDRAFRQASRQIAWDDALEVAHDVASELVARRASGADDPDDPRSFDALIHRVVTFRLRDFWRAARRRAAAERVHHEERASTPPAWTDPGGALEVTELAAVVDVALNAMPDAMRAAYLLVRREGRSYREAAEQLGVGVGTVHTQLSRANARLRDAVQQYRAAGDADDRHAHRPTNAVTGNS